ncbi:hypothetical protein MPY17_40120 (plasmid) [Rhodococcus opacus]|uniref:hypothetical protein n=1 Tax=Rhodococcus opacus TaxID=37919 RepID=UPI001FF3E576|nr:hypothetical protein [Rhodococcus opacus]UOT08469.1 hypothetical protein MPY17_40120 [Rhodococcus opacus]
MSAAVGFPMPRIAGIDGGVGTSLVATMLKVPFDSGKRGPGEQVDVLVCRSVTGQIARAIATTMAMPVPPVLVVVDDCGQSWPKTARQRIEMARPNLPAVVRVPWIEQLRSVDDPHLLLAEALHGHDYLDEVPRWALPAQKAAQELVTAVTGLLTERHETRLPAPESNNDNQEEHR